jgi:pimeloyl-ACP methyl ester carboxylesterase
VSETRDVLLDAEQRLYRSLGLEHHSRLVDLTGAPVGRVRVLDIGSGPPVLLLHGAGMVGSIWAPLLVHLRGRRCIAVDLPGCGLTDPFDHGGTDLRQHGRSFLSAVLAALRLDSVAVVGNSLGATYALYLAAADPSRLSHVIAMGAPGVALPGGRGSAAMALYSRPTIGRAVSAVSPPISPRLARRMLAGICGRPAVDAVPDPMFDVLAAAMRISEPTIRTLMPELFSGRTPRSHHALTDDELAQVQVPTLFVWGDGDRFQAPAAGERAAAVMGAAALSVMAGGHHPWWDDAAGCARLIDDHLATAEPAS